MQMEPGSSALEEAGVVANSIEKDFEKCLTRSNKERTVRRPYCACLSPHGTKRPHTHAFAKQRHWQTHAGEHSYRCVAVGCAKSFFRKDHLQDHLQTHADGKRRRRENKEPRETKDKPKSACDAAHASYTGERPYPCTVCAKSFRRAQHCLNHMLRVHTGERPFKCGTCSAGFVRRWDLTRHSKVHTGFNSIFPCKTCGRAFSRNSARMNHSKNCQAN